MTTDLLDIDDMEPDPGREIKERPPWADEAESAMSMALSIARHLPGRRVRISPLGCAIDILPEGS